MNFTSEKSKLVGALSVVGKAVAQKTTIPALEGILITASKDKIELCGYNTELGIKTTIPVKVKKEGKMVLNANLLTEIIRKMPEEIVEVDVTSKLTAKIKSGASVFELTALDPKDFPEMPGVEEGTGFKLPVNTIKSMIRQTIFAVSDSDAKPIHMGSLFELKNKELTIVSVDGYRLALRRELTGTDGDLRFVVPGKTLREVLRLLPENDDESELEVLAGSRHIIFKSGEYTVISRLLEGEFLDYKTTIPKESKTKVDIETKLFIESVERISLLITDRLKSPVRCDFKEDELNLSCTTAIGKANDAVAAKIEGDNSFEFAFNNKYMLDALKNTDTDEIQMFFNGALSPIKITPKNGDSFLFLVLPVRLRAE